MTQLIKDKRTKQLIISFSPFYKTENFKIFVQFVISIYLWVDKPEKYMRSVGVHI